HRALRGGIAGWAFGVATDAAAGGVRTKIKWGQIYLLIGTDLFNLCLQCRQRLNRSVPINK
ncbi:MAG: hypothetical protein V3R72_09865, partial [Gammaproteobacteria bacterium]